MIKQNIVIIIISLQSHVRTASMYMIVRPSINVCITTSYLTCFLRAGQPDTRLTLKATYGCAEAYLD